MATCVRRRVPNNHSCLFAAFLYLCEEGEYSDAGCNGLRSFCSDMVEQDPDTYSDLRLGMANAEYRAFMENPFTWGGENEIIILSAKFGVEVAVTSSQSLRSLVYNEGAEGGRINLLYTGQHYDPLVQLSSGEDDGDEVRVLPKGEPAASFTAAAVGIAKGVAEAQARRLKEIRKKMIKCGGCGALLDGSSAFQEHCGEVEHDDEFGYDCTEVEVVIDEEGGTPVEVAKEDEIVPGLLELSKMR